MDRFNYTLLPSLPGVYLFKDKDHSIIYVGKAKSIKKRVQSYFRKKEYDWKIKALIDEFITIDHIVTKSESDALLLEAQLIRDNKPKFNVLLKNGQPFLYIVKLGNDIPRLELVRNKKKKGTYFGPFLFKKQARAVYNYLMQTFKLSLCSKKVPTGCLLYHLGICAGNCRDQFDKDDYSFRLELAVQLMSGHYKKSVQNIKNQIILYNQQFEFEKAKRLVYYLENLEFIFDTLKDKFSEKKYTDHIFEATTPINRKTEPDLALSDSLQELLKLPTKPAIIDCFDVSHFQSTHIVGSCIRFIHGIPEKSSFRHFNVKTLTQQNDYAALQEIVSRRYREGDVPDLVLIDGGKGQLNAITQILPNAEIISLAKRHERLYTKQYKDGIIIDVQSRAGKMLIALRDYAHHFAINHHRVRRKNNSITE